MTTRGRGNKKPKNLLGAELKLAPIARAIALILATGGAIGQAHAAPAFSSGWFANKGAMQDSVRNTGLLPNGMPATGLNNSDLQRAQQQTQKSIADLGLAAQGIAAQQAWQASQRQLALSGGNGGIPDGLAAGGLNVDTNSLTQTWINAQAPTQAVDGSGHVTVNVTQTASRAILSWSSFNVGKNTTLNFDQSGGTQSNGANDWVVLNRINDPGTKPSTILGSITAQGSVYVIDRNGIMFGGGSQVNVHALVASSLDFLNTNDDLVQTSADVAASNALFLQSVGGGLAGLEAGSTLVSASSGNPNEVLGLGNKVTVNSAGQYQPPGDVTIEPGASITTQTSGSASDGGFVLIAGTNVNNGGTITSTTGQVVLAAGAGVSLSPNPESPQQLLPELSGEVVIPSASHAVAATDITAAGTLTNTGLVQTARGSINLLGSSVAQDGVVAASTSVTTPGAVTISTVDEYIANTPMGTAYPGQFVVMPTVNGGGLDTHRAGQLVFGPESVTTILPDGDGETATSSPGVSFIPGSITMTAGSIWMQGGSLIEAPAATVSVNALTPSVALDATAPNSVVVQGRVYVDSGATIDVAGLANVQEAVADTLVTIDRIGQNELADSPLLRDSFLFGLKDVVIDSTLSGTRADGTPWVGSPVLNAQGYVDLIPRSIDQLLTNGGTITLAGNEVMTATGSSLNLDGGYVHYLGGMVNTTVVEDQYGRLIPIGQADPNDVIVGIAGQYVSNHPRWGVSETYQNALIGRSIYEDDFVVGGNAGTLNVFGSKAVVLDGNMDAQAVSGTKQVQDNNQPTGGAFNLGEAAAANLTQGPTSSATGESSLVILQNDAPQLNGLAPDFGATTALDTNALGALSATDPDNVLATIVVPVNMLNSGGFADVSVGETSSGASNGITVAPGTQLTVQPGGSITLTSPSVGVSVLGSLVAPSGTISISSGGNIVVGPNALISVAGLWVNNAVQIASNAPSGSSEYINGGSITISTVLGGSAGASGGTGQNGMDTSGSIILMPGSVLDVSSGGEVQADGQMLMANGIAEGTAGSVSLLTYSNNATKPYGALGAPVLPLDQPTAGRLEMDGTIDSFGLAGGGTLTLQALGFQIGGDAAQAPVWDLYLPADFFAQQGFGKYVLNALYDATVAPGATVALTQRNLIPNVAALQQAASGTDIDAAGLTTPGTTDPYHRQATDLVMTAGAYLAWQTPAGQRVSYTGVTGGVTVGAGAAIVGDAGASIGLGSPAQVTVLGSLIAPGGAITLSADSADNGFALPGQEGLGTDQSFSGFTSPTKSVWLGSDAVLDTAGVALTDPFAPFVRSGFDIVQANTGKVLPGGSVTISDDSGYVVAQAGSRIDVSGASATFDEAQADGYVPQLVWSDAGSITLAASSGLLFDATLQAQPGATQAQGGTLTILPEQTVLSAAVGAQPGGGVPASNPGAQILVLQQSGDLVPAGLMPGEAFPGESTVTQSGKTSVQTSTGMLQFVVDRLTGSGIATLVIGGDAALNVNKPAPVPVAFAGNVDLTLSDAVQINTGRFVAATDGATVSITAPYVAVVGPTPLNGNSAAFLPIETVSDSVLNIDASFIDLENQFQLNNFGQANFTSSGDIRLTSTNADPTGSNALAVGELFTPGNLTFQAADVYPSTGSTFILDAVGPADATTGDPASTTITFLPNGTSGVPLSAGGTLLVDATNIVQSGTVRAPSGSLIFGVGDTTDAATKTQFNNLPLVATDSVALASGSVTSVSLDGAIVPYGTTVDGVEWQFNPVAGGAQPDVTAPPMKFVSVNGSSVALNPGATIDLSGGGNLQAEEWVPGTGGSRDVLAQYNVSYAASASGVALPINVGAANVYAIVPGPQPHVAAYDPVFAQTIQPSKNANGSVSTTTDSMGVGQASLTDAVGKSVYLSGVPGLPAGYYTLLPAKYATLPGAYRVTVASSAGTVVPGEHATAPDGTQVVAGYWGNALTGSHSATPTLFDVQSGATWQQYSQYTLTGANSFFPSLAAGAGNVTPPLPMDAGQLVLAATNSLTLGALLRTQAATGGAPAEIDIASQDIQIVGNAEAALPGYIQISADQLDALNAGSLLIGGTRTQTSTGITIDTIANSVVVSNDAADPLSGPEIILVTKTGSTGTDPNAANGLRIDSGSVISAQGSYPVAKDQPITIGQVADSKTGATAVSGDGALLSVSNGGNSVITRLDATGNGLLTVGAGAMLTGGQALTLDSSGNLTFDPTATLSGDTIAVDGSAITFTSQTGAGAAALAGFVVGPAQLAQLAAAQEVILRSAGAMNFDGTVDVTFGNEVDLSAGSFSSDGGAVTINAKNVILSNEIGAPAPTGTAGAGTLTVNADEIDFGTGNKTVDGFGSATFTAAGGIVGQETGTFDFGALPVTLNAPVYLADTGSGQTIRTTGALNLNSAPGTALTLAAAGGALSFIGATVNDNGATIEASAGNVSLEATTGDLTIANNSLISSAGVAKQFFDETLFAPGGAITLTADTGNVNVETGSTLDFSAANGGGAAGSLMLAAPDQAVQLAGAIKGNAAPGFRGGSFSLNTGAAVDLDDLSAELTSSGVNDGISVWTHAGNLILSAGNTLTAQTVSLTADGGAGNASDTVNGNVVINGTINANGVTTVLGGAEGGTINLYGKSGVDVEGTLQAEGSDAYISGAPIPTINPDSIELGGTINIGTSGTPTAGSYNTQYGYENVALANSGKITLGAHAHLDVSGGGALTMASNGLQGGVVNLRAPLLSDGGTNGGNYVDVDAEMAGPGSGIVGARAVNLEAYTVWSTTDTTTGARHFDGIVDPAGWYDNSGNLLAGIFTTQTGQTIDYTPGSLTAAQLAADLANDFFAPTNYNTDHESFYGYQAGGATATTPGTLMGFIETGLTGVVTQFAGTPIAHFNVVPGIDLDNPDPSINDGNISILTNWNLGAGTSPTTLAFRFNGQAPAITFRAENNVNVDASLTDGFFQISNPTAPPLQTITITAPTPLSASAAYTQFFCGGGYCRADGSDYYSLAYDNQFNYSGALAAPAAADNPALAGGNLDEIEQYYGLYEDYQTYVRKNTEGNSIFRDAARGAQNSTPIPGQPLFTESVPTAAMELADNTAYLRYLADYQAYADKLYAWASLEQNQAVQFQAVLLQPPPIVLTSLIQSSTQTTGSIPFDNTPSPIATSANGLPLQTASLNGGSSASFRIVAGADLSSTNPLSVQAASMFATTGGGNVTLGGSFAYIDANGRALLAPTTIRTGTGSIDIAAGDNVELFDPTQQSDSGELTVPGVIYTAGAPAENAPTGDAATIVSGSATAGVPDILVSPTVNPDAGGNISIHAQNNVIGLEDVSDTTGVVTGFASANISQFWWQWMQVGNPTNLTGQITQTSIDFGEFDQGVMSVGGNVSVSAGGNVTDLAVSLPTTWYLTNNNATANTIGGGNLTVAADGSILSGDYFVAKGTGAITAGAQIAPDANQPLQFFSAIPVATVLATQDGILNVSARQGANIGGVFDPSYISNNVVTPYHQKIDEQGYSSISAVSVESTTGDVDFGTLGSVLPANGGSSSELPATVSLTAFTGGISVLSGGSLFPSATGNLNLIADQSINFSGLSSFGMSDADPSAMPSPTQPDAIASADSQTALHGDDNIPARIYSLTGNIIDGILGLPGSQNAGFYNDLLSLVVDKPALIEAGQDIVNLEFQGQNLRESDVTRIMAGHDIYDAQVVGGFAVPSLVLGGPGTFDVEAGRNIGPLTQAARANAGVSTGIDAVGNALNPNLPHESANINVLFGVGPGIDDAGFISAYIDPVSTAADVPSAMPALIAFMEQYDAGLGVDTGLAKDKAAAQAAVGTLTADAAWSQFQTLPSYVQNLFVQQVFFGVLTDVGNDFNNPSSPFFNQYARGYQAINTLFPAGLGYTANNLGGGANGANALVSTGNLDIRSTTIQTQQGGNVSILGPGGEALVGSSSAPPEIVNNGRVIAGPGTMGILTLEQGDINIFTDLSVLLAQSRIFTEQGGAMTIWSSNGDINAGKGAKSAADVPPPLYVCDVNHYCSVDARGEVTGAGIATLQTIPGAPASDATLVAPRGTVDAGDAGIRVSGNLNVAALQVLNADNIQVQGKSTGIPVIAQVNVAALTSASMAASAAANAAEDVVHQQQAAARQALPSIITVQVLGFGSDTSSDNTAAPSFGAPDQPAKSSGLQSSGGIPYNAASTLTFVGVGDDFDSRQMAQLSDAQRRHVEQGSAHQ